MNKSGIAAIIPARMNSKRYPGKPLIKIKGLPMIEHVRRRAHLCNGFSKIIVATCDKEIKDTVESYGGMVIMTSKKHIMASDRVAEAAEQIQCSHIINIQGDEILFMPDDVNKMIKFIYKNYRFDYFNAVGSIKNFNEIKDDNVVKCILSVNEKILFCTRELKNLKFSKNYEPVKKILGILGYSKKGLRKFSKLKRTPFEKANSIDQSRIIENDYVLKGVKFIYSYPGINNRKEEELIKKILKKDKKQQEILEKIL
tara:strand:+ start:6288 stop:7055 length:768 start_codon:yes stop_codon:yes gene_type:complete